MANKAKILVVEDNDFVRMQIVKFLTDADFEVAESSDGQQAMDTISNDTDLAIVDVRMEPVGGFEFIKNIRSRDIATPVVLVTGDQNPDMLHDASHLGVGAILMKPVERERLVKTVERTIEMARRAS